MARATFSAVLDREPSDDELDRLYAEYLLHLDADIGVSKGYRLLPGVAKVLLRLQGAGVTLGLVSCAMEGAARTKLVPADLNRFFIFGAYGSESPDRTEMTEIAIAKAVRLHRPLSVEQVYVVGDTPHDMRATNASGAVSVGVGSGHYTVDELAAVGGTHVLASLEDDFPGLPATTQ